MKSEKYTNVELHASIASSAQELELNSKLMVLHLYSQANLVSKLLRQIANAWNADSGYL